MEKKAQVKKSSTVWVIWKKFLRYVFQENNFLVKQLQNAKPLGEGTAGRKETCIHRTAEMWAAEFGAFS